MQHTKRTGRAWWVGAAVIVTTMVCVPAWAQALSGSVGGIRVTGRGASEARPDMVELMATISGEAELAADAIVKYRDNRRRAVEAIEQLEIAGLEVVASGLRLAVGGDSSQQMQAMMRGQPTAQTAAQVKVFEPLRIQLTDISKLEDHELAETIIRIIDAGKDAGVSIGPSMPANMFQAQFRQGKSVSLVQFKLSDATKSKHKAYEAAMTDARTQAQRLAKLAGVKLGSVISVVETPGGTKSQNPMMQYYAMMGITAATADKYTSDSLDPIKVSVNLAVQFAIE